MLSLLWSLYGLKPSMIPCLRAVSFLSLSLFSLLATLQYSRRNTFSHLIPSQYLHALAQQWSSAGEALLFPSFPPYGWEWDRKSEILHYFVRFRDSVIETLRDWHLAYFCNPLLFVCWKQRTGTGTTSNLVLVNCELLWFSYFCTALNGQVLCYTVHFNSLWKVQFHIFVLFHFPFMPQELNTFAPAG